MVFLGNVVGQTSPAKSLQPYACRSHAKHANPCLYCPGFAQILSPSPGDVWEFDGVWFFGQHMVLVSEQCSIQEAV